jgi:large subunit ribosomal protein L30
MSKTIVIEQYRGLSGRPKDQRDTVRGLGLKKIRQQRTLVVTDAVMGMIKKVPHIVKVINHGS